MHQSIFDIAKPSMVVIPLLRNTTAVVSKVVDMQGYDNVDFLLAVGATDTTVDAQVFESDNADGSSPSDITGAAIAQIGATGDNVMAIVSVQRNSQSKRYVGIKVTPGTGTTGADVAVVAVRYGLNGVTAPIAKEVSSANAYATSQFVKV